jgi:hypothetical protein
VGPVRKQSMKSTAILRGALLGVALLADVVSAANSSKEAAAFKNGTGAVSGQLSGTFCNQVVYGAGETVTLNPLSSGSGGRALSIRTDAEGRFVFGDLPPGEYELRTQLDWTTTYVEVYDDGTRDRLYADHSKQLVALVQVKPHQTAHVTTFSESGTRDAIYAYGGILSKPHHPLVNCQ